ncbi:MAG: hypothetical protein R2762_01740 [Bryobacteraceae bacterium]
MEPGRSGAAAGRLLGHRFSLGAANRFAGAIGDAVPAKNFTRFLLTPNAALRGFPPLELLQSAYSFQDLLDFVESGKSGDMI